LRASLYRKEDDVGTFKWLLAVGAMLGMATGAAQAGRLVDFTGNPASVTGTGTLTTPDGFVEMGSPTTGAQGLESETATPWSKPAPGTINMRINLFVNEFPTMAWWSGMNGNGTPASNAGNKQQGFGIWGWIRIDLGIDGQTRNGIKYGAFTEIRENNTTAVTGTSGTTATSGFGQSASSDSSDNTLYVRHANVYLGTDQVGFLRIGTAIGADTLLETGLNDDYDINWSNISSNIPTNMVPVWPWADAGGEYMAARIAYASPVIFGFDGVISFAPNNSTPFDGSGCSEPYGGVGCATQSSSTFSGDFSNRFRNQLGIGLRYRDVIGPVGFAVAGIYTFSGKVNNVGGQAYNGQSIGNVGAQVTFDHVLSVGANVEWGAFNGNWALQPVGGAEAVAWVVGGKYTLMQAPMTFGVNYFSYKYQGDFTPANGTTFTQRVSQGVDVGATYGLGPGVVLLAEYAWGQNYQGNFNFLTSNAAGTNIHANNKVWGQLLTAGMSVRF
jgi:hypothetical protein